MEEVLLQALKSLSIEDPETANYIKDFMEQAQEQIKGLAQEQVKEQVEKLIERLFYELPEKLGGGKEELKPFLEAVIIEAQKYQATIAEGDPRAFGGQAEKDKVLKSAIAQVEHLKAKATAAINEAYGLS